MGSVLCLGLMDFRRCHFGDDCPVFAILAVRHIPSGRFILLLFLTDSLEWPVVTRFICHP